MLYKLAYVCQPALEAQNSTPLVEDNTLTEFKKGNAFVYNQ